MKLLSFHCEPDLKHAVLERLKKHQLLDEIVQGTYWENGKGCLIGCALHSAHHSAFETHLGLPEWLAHLTESIFEGLPKKEAIKFPVQCIEAIPVGADLSLVWHQFAAWLILDPDHGVHRFNSDPRILDVGHMHADSALGKGHSDKEWHAAGFAAGFAGGSAAGYTAGSAARYAQRDEILRLLLAAPVETNPEPRIPCIDTLNTYKADLKESVL